MINGSSLIKMLYLIEADGLVNLGDGNFPNMVWMIIPVGIFWTVVHLVELLRGTRVLGYPRVLVRLAGTSP